ncbi:hypothetical protein GOBAR_AA13397 [Gossypium barbadense]|uniref:Uncharacterized protein n=1 Tax=Gossypium barbadense TaxID=3634 RepID=A0A2P5XV89_GOSBA|nr:hypothetical protein GOBAR_AA13397 [Gossypium barbadense]
MEKHGRARGKARFCFFDTGVAVDNNTRAWYPNTWAWEKPTKLGTTVQYGRGPHTPKTHGRGIVAGHDLNCKIRKTQAHFQSNYLDEGKHLSLHD